jgi:hypothetical protein
VEPGYEKKFETLQEVLDSSINYGYITVFEIFMSTMEFSDHLQFPHTRRFDCVDVKTCLRKIMSDGDVATLSAPEYATYIFNEYGHQSEMTYPCSLDENLIYGYLVAVFAKGSPLVSQFNTNLRRCKEGGFGERYWAQMNHEALLRSRTTSDEDGNSMYFVFTLSHMVPAFSVLGFGYLCSTIIFIAECLHKRFIKR